MSSFLMGKSTINGRDQHVSLPEPNVSEKHRLISGTYRLGSLSRAHPLQRRQHMVTAWTTTHIAIRNKIAK